MQRNKSKLLLFFCIFCLMLSCLTLKAQIQCPPVSPWTEYVDMGKVKYTPFPFNQGSGVSADAKVILYSSPPIVIIDWSTFQNDLKPISDESAKEYLLLEIAKKASGLPLGNCTVASPTEYTVHIPTVSKCTVLTSCLNKLDFSERVICDRHDLVANEVYEENGNAYWRSFKTKYCGDKCCTIVVKVKCINSPHNGQVIPSFTKNTLENIPCPPSGLTRCHDPEFPPPPTPEILPCQGPCELGE